ncbi:hypothetical protein AWB81_00555 [Caballeronia arationis]|jgi:hypothetical protein|uniref:Lipoprotein n=1 Tax=Caballeronia arationis TaxID=1777142 RepID=A0A7Z7I3I4_9BURK|nr:hypothetical protein [Caballeronia arationis]SAK47094.1 hypothetical protein AWB81_00555 [Caballeronia arationis]SOE59089.1 hypothetical protein SAMN05446927_1693 [Caballeronia arationis]
MKHGKKLVVSTLLALTCGVAMAQNGGGSAGGQGGTGGGNAHGAATAGPTAGGDPASGAMSGPSKKTHKTPGKAATDTTNFPGANASSDAKGQ